MLSHVTVNALPPTNMKTASYIAQQLCYKTLLQVMTFLSGVAVP